MRTPGPHNQPGRATTLPFGILGMSLSLSPKLITQAEQALRVRQTWKSVRLARRPSLSASNATPL